MDRLTAQEEEAMLVIWNLGECAVKDILMKYSDPKPPYTTLASIVNNLKRKNFVSVKRFGNVYVYSPRVKQADYKSSFMGGVVHNYFSSSYKDLVSFMVDEQKLSADDLKDIITLIEKGKEK